MRLVVFLTFISSIAPATVLADGIKITSPQGGTSVDAGATFDVEWADDGGSPDLSGLGTIAAIQIYFGGSQPETDATAVGACAQAPGIQASVKKVTCEAPAGASAQSVTNGFYLAVTSDITDGGTIINYSQRFSVNKLIGVDTPSADAVQAAQDASGVDDVPEEVNGATAAAAAADPAAAAGAGEATVPYNLQTGLTKYAPMQPVPPTKITAKGYSRLFSTSAYSKATTWMPQPKFATTLTASQTFSVKSIENTVSPVPGPTASRDADMAKYLARWKD